MELRGFSGLPGAGFGLLSDGTPSINGALSFSTPIGFSMKGNTYDIGLSDRSRNDAPQMVNLTTHFGNPSDSTGQVMVGVGTPAGNFTLAYEIESSELDQSYNAQWQLPLHLKNAGVSVGVQNITNRPLAAGDKLPGQFDDATSIYAVGTYMVAPNDYVSLGYGDVRFRGPFANASALVAPRLKATLEWDSITWNVGFAYSFSRIRGLGDNLDGNETTLWFGLFECDKPTIGLNFVF